jgi:hypothetical protein
MLNLIKSVILNGQLQSHPEKFVASKAQLGTVKDVNSLNEAQTRSRNPSFNGHGFPRSSLSSRFFNFRQH